MPTEDIVKGADLGEYLDHIAWAGIVQPWLHQQKESYQKWLVQAVLGGRPMEMNDGSLFGPERIASYIEAINSLETMFKIINAKRDSALAQLPGSSLHNLKDIE